MSDAYFNNTNRKALVNGLPVYEEVGPVSPAYGDQWILHNAGSPQTKLEGTINVIGGIGDFHVIVNSALLADTHWFGDQFSGSYGNISFTNAAFPTGMVVVTPTPPNMGSMNITYGSDMTWNDIVTELNAWAVANLSGGVAPICNLTQSGNDGPLTPDSFQLSIYLASDQVYEQVNLYVQMTTGQFIGQLNGPF
jgi:hypothetical protein